MMNNKVSISLVVDGADASAKSVESVSKKLNDLAEKSQQASAKSSNAWRGAAADFAHVGQSLLIAKSAFDGFAGAVGKIGGAMIEAQMSAQKLKNSLEFSSGGIAKAAQEIEYLRKVSRDMGLDFTTASNAYAKFSAASRSAGISAADTRLVFEGVAKAGQRFGLSAQEMEGAFLAIGQMASKGVVSMEELRGQLGERLPVALDMAAKSMGVTQREFIKMVESGQVLASDFLPKFGRALNDNITAPTNSLVQEINRLTSAWDQWKQSLAEGTDGGGFKWLTRGLNESAAAMRALGTEAGLVQKILMAIGGFEAGAIGKGKFDLGEVQKQKIAELSDVTRRYRSLEGKNKNYLEQGEYDNLAMERDRLKQEIQTLGEQLARKTAQKPDIKGDFLAQQAKENERLKTYLDDLKNAPKAAKIAAEVEAENKAFATAVNGLQETDKRYQNALRAHQDRVSEIKSRGAEKSGTNDASQIFAAQIAAERDFTQTQVKLIKERVAQRVISEEDGIEQTIAAQQEGYEKQAAMLQAQFAKAADVGDKSKIAQEIAKLNNDMLEFTEQAATARAKMGEAAIKARQAYLAGMIADEEKHTQSLKKSNDALRDEIATIGLSAEEQAAYAAAKLESAAASEWAAAKENEEAAEYLKKRDLLPDMVESYYKLAEAHREVAKAMGEQGGLQRERGVKKAADDARKEWEKTADSINNSLTDALLRGFESGKSFAENFRDTLKNMFQTLVLRPVISAIMAPVAGGIASLLPGTAAAGQGGVGGVGASGLINTGSSLYNLASGGGLLGGFSAGAASVASELALGASFVGPSATLAGGAIGAGASTAAATGSAAGAGALAGAASALPWIGGALAIASLFGGGGLFGKKAKTPKINLINADIDGWSQFDTPFGTVSGAAKHDKNFAQTFEGLKPIAQMDASLAAMLSQSEIDTVKAALAGTGTGEVKSKGNVAEDFVRNRLDIITDAVGGWINDLADTAEGELQDVYTQTAQILATRKMAGAETLAKELMGEGGAAFLRESETVAAGFVRMQQSLAAVRPVLAAVSDTTLGFNAAGASVASALVDAMGGLESFATSAGFFVEQFLTDAEKFKIGLDAAAENVRGAQEKLTEAFGEYGLTVPKTRDDFKALARAIDLTSEAGRDAFAALMQVAPAFDAVSDAIERMTSQKTSLLAKVTQTATDVPALADFNAMLKPFDIVWDHIISRAEAAEALNKMDASNPANAWFFSLAEQLEPMLAKVWTAQETAAKTAADAVAKAQEEAARAAADEWQRLTDEMGGLKDRYAELQREYQRAVYQEQIDGFDAQIDAAQKSADAARDALNNWQRAAKALADWRDSLLGDLASPLGGGYANALSRFAITSAQARAGSIDAMGNLPGVGKSLLDASRDAAKTKLDYARDYAKVLATASDTQGIAQSQVSVAQQQLNAALSQIDWLKKQRDAIEDLMDSGEKNTDRIQAEMLVVEGQIAALAASMSGLGAALSMARSATGSGSGGGSVSSGSAAGSSAGGKTGGAINGVGSGESGGYVPGSRTLTDAELFAYGFHPSERGNLDRLAGELSMGNAYDYIQSELGQFSFLSNAYGLKSSDFDDRQKLALWEQYTKGAGAVKNGLSQAEIDYIKSDAFKDVTVSASTLGQVMLDLNSTGSGTMIDTTYNGTAYTTADIQGAAQNIIDAGGTMLDVYAATKASSDSGSGVNLAMVSDALGFSSADLSKWLDENDLPGFAVGTNYVPSDMVANIHEGERIIPAADNRALMRAINGGGDQSALIESLIEEVRLLRAEARATASHTAETNRKLRDMSPDGTRLEVVVSA